MLLIVGLGNPGLKFKKTRHNIGFRVLDALQKENNLPKFKLNKKAKVEITKGEINGQVVFLAKPQTFMNNSGHAVKFLLKENGFTEDSLIVIHDDFDLPFGEVKIAENSGSGGHHGVGSIIESLGTKNFKRIKIGIRPVVDGLPPTSPKAEDFVLKKFTKNEEKELPVVIRKVLAVLD
ncbi:MAG: aminoacyl-tRNA hydrolase [bacterium]|nr:aminoacyl-tRNA hydrolase [bacterium]